MTASNNSCSSHCHGDENKRDWLFIIGFSLVILAYLLALLPWQSPISSLNEFNHHCFELLNTMWWGVLIGLFFVGFLSFVNQEYIYSILGEPHTIKGILRATLAGVFLDLCSHGILMVGMNLYKKGAGLGQVMAFLIASPWNSFSLTFILIALIGLPYTLLFIFASLVIAVCSGYTFIYLEKQKILPPNPNMQPRNYDFDFWQEFKKDWGKISWRPATFRRLFLNGLQDSKIVLKWLFIGVILASLMRVFIEDASYTEYFGATATGMFFSLLLATIIEVCSEGTTPIAADIVNKAAAPGNGFLFLMTGVSTDYTEIMSLKETTGSWKIAMFLPLVTLPQILAISAIINFAF